MIYDRDLTITSYNIKKLDEEFPRRIYEDNSLKKYYPAKVEKTDYKNIIIFILLLIIAGLVIL